MTYQPATITTEKPEWAALADYVEDVTDAHQDATDPDREFDVCCNAFFDVAEVEAWSSNPYDEATAKEATLIGIATDDGYGWTYYGRAVAVEIFGADWVSSAEEMTSRALTESAEYGNTDPFDHRCDAMREAL